MKMWQWWDIKQESPLLPSNLPLISPSPCIVIIVSGREEGRYK